MKDNETGPGARQADKRIVLIVSMLSAFLTPFTSSSINIALPSISADLSLDAVDLNWVATAYLLAGATLLVPFGRLGDIHGRKRIFQLGIITNGVASLLCALSPSGAWLIAFRALQGLGGALIFGTGTAILTAVYPAEERGRALGYNVSSVYTGLSVGPLIGGFTTQHFGWQSAFLLNALLCIVICLLVLFRMPGEWAEARGEKFDFVGSLVHSVGVVALMYAFSVMPAAWGYGLMGFALACLAVFAKWEGRQEFPVLPIGLLRHNTVFLLSNLTALINYSATFAVSFLLSLYLQYIGGLTPANAGLVLLAQPVMMVACSPLAGSLSDKVEPRIVASIGMALTTAGLAMLAFLGWDASLPLAITGQVILGAGFGLLSSPNTNAVMSSVSRKFYGVASGTLGTMRLTGQALSQGLVLLLFSIQIGKVEIGPANYSAFLTSMKIALTVSALICLAGVFASGARGRTR